MFRNCTAAGDVAAATRHDAALSRETTVLPRERPSSPHSPCCHRCSRHSNFSTHRGKRSLNSARAFAKAHEGSCEARLSLESAGEQSENMQIPTISRKMQQHADQTFVMRVTVDRDKLLKEVSLYSKAFWDCVVNDLCCLFLEV